MNPIQGSRDEDDARKPTALTLCARDRTSPCTWKLIRLVRDDQISRNLALDYATAKIARRKLCPKVPRNSSSLARMWALRNATRLALSYRLARIWESLSARILSAANANFAVSSKASREERQDIGLGILLNGCVIISYSRALRNTCDSRMQSESCRRLQSHHAEGISPLIAESHPLGLDHFCKARMNTQLCSPATNPDFPARIRP